MTDPASTQHDLQPTPQQQRRGMRNAIFTQMASSVGNITFTSGFLLLYLTKLGFSDKIIIVLLSSYTVQMMLLSTPTAFIIDRTRIKRIGYFGAILSTVSFAVMTLGASFPEPIDRWVVAMSIIGFGAGLSVFNTGWFPLLKGIVPEQITGRFFGLLRLSWQTVAMIFVMAYSLVLRSESQLWLFQAVLAAMLVGQCLKVIFYARVPEFSTRVHQRRSMVSCLRKVIGAPLFMPFCAYCFVLSLFTVAMPTLFNLVEKTHLDLGDNTVAFLGGALMIGAMIGYSLGGVVVDRLGTKLVFMGCHLGFMVTACLFPLRDMFGLPAMVYLPAIHVIWGILGASSSIAMSSELFAVMPVENRSLATAVWWSLSSGGGAMSGLIAAGAVSLGFLQTRWSLFGHIVSQYDALILVYGVMTGLMAVTLGLVPSVIGQARWLPRSST